MKQVIKFATFFLITAFVIASCKKEKVTEQQRNKSLSAYAGIDQMIILPTDSIELRGTGTVYDNIITYRWSKISGPSSSLIIDTKSAVTKVKNLVPGIYQFEIMVTDKAGFSEKDTVQISVNNNNPPVANAGTDVSSELLTCLNRTAFFELDGSGSSDPENNIIGYKWTALYGPPGYILRNPVSAKTRVESLWPGKYAFELVVTDLGGFTSKDTVLLTVNGTPGTAKEYDLDITTHTTFEFLNNYTDWDYYGYYDLALIKGKGIFMPLAELDISIEENSDTSDVSNIHDTHIEISKANHFQLKVRGDCSINFKKIIRGGGGSFAGTLNITSGSATACDSNVFANLPPLTVTGSLDVTTHKVTLRIKGKVYF